MTIHHLLNHTSGIPVYTDKPDFFPNVSRNPYAVADFVKKYASGDLRQATGSKFQYNNSAYYLLGAVIEKVTGKSYAEAIKEHIFVPAGMNNSGYDLSSPLIRETSSGIREDARRIRECSVPRHVASLRGRLSLLDGGRSVRVGSGVVRRQDPHTQEQRAHVQGRT